MILSHKHKFIFVHTSKTGGTSIMQALLPHLGEEDVVYGWDDNWNQKHLTAIEVRMKFPKEWEEYYKFGFVRHPLDRMVSAYHYWKMKGHNDWWLNSFGEIPDTFDEYVRTRDYTTRHSLCQSLCNPGGRVLVDKVGRFETLNEDFQEIAERIGIEVELPHVNASNHDDYMSYYTPETSCIVTAHFKQDIEVFYPPFEKKWQITGNNQSNVRLCFRHRRIIERNADLLKGRKVLDIASHDGRWTHAALQCGADHVTGVEARSLLVGQARSNLSEHDGSKYKIIEGDIHEIIRGFDDDEFDCVLCCGFLYHTPHHIYMLEQIARITKQSFILDTNVIPHDQMMSRYHLELTDNVGAIYSEESERAFAATPSRSLLNRAINHFGFEHEYIHFDDPAPHIEDYFKKLRVTIRATSKRKVLL